jgi:1-deoxy-D-xylulose-5-phosphate reductoisomerase
VVGLADASREHALRDRLGGRWNGELFLGADAPERIARLPEVDVVLNGLVGALGLRPSWSAVRAGKRLALANKESLVVAGHLLTREARAQGVPILPVDSEHNALFQLLHGQKGSAVARVILTASGGPFRTRALDTMAAVTPAEALAHPTWSMGERITIDSATLLNKGFEVLEARWLFDLEPEQVAVWIHPQSIVHGLVEWVDGSTTAQLSTTDMRIPIQLALCHPERIDGGLPRCHLPSLGPLEFLEADEARYPCLRLAREALRAGGTAPAVLNAADEVLVASFLKGEIAFPQIAEGLARVLDRRPSSVGETLDAVLAADAWAREEVRSVLVRCR